MVSPSVEVTGTLAAEKREQIASSQSDAYMYKIGKRLRQSSKSSQRLSELGDVVLCDALSQRLDAY